MGARPCGMVGVCARHGSSCLLWIVVDVAYVGTFVITDLRLTAGLYAAMIVLEALGYRRWHVASTRA